MRLKNQIIYLFFALILMTSCNWDESAEGDKYYNNKQYQEAIEAYSSFLENNPKNLNGLYNRGRSYEELGQFEKAEADFKNALALDDKNVQVMLSLSNLYQKMKNHDLALLYANYAAATPGAPATAFFLKGRAYHQIGNTENAMKEYSTAIKMNPEYGQAYYYRGMLKLATKQKRSACEDLKKAVSLNHQQGKEALEKYCQ